VVASAASAVAAAVAASEDSGADEAGAAGRAEDGETRLAGCRVPGAVPSFQVRFEVPG
jgi:hypothetical protein